MVDNKTSFVAGDLEMTPFQAVIIPIPKGGDTLLLFFFEGFCCQGQLLLEFSDQIVAAGLAVWIVARWRITTNTGRCLLLFLLCL